MTEELRDFKITCLKCKSDDVIVEIEGSIDFGGWTGVQPGSVVIKCKPCGHAQIFYT